jgi:hypothetical protein
MNGFRAVACYVLRGCVCVTRDLCLRSIFEGPIVEVSARVAGDCVCL